MQGRIKMFNAAKAFGFIIGDDNKDYFFHVTSLQSEEYPAPGMPVSFTPSIGTKGLVANQISIDVTGKSNRPEFFCCGNTRIRLNNIKDYRIDMVHCEYAPVIDSVTHLKCDMVPVKIHYEIMNENLKIEFFDEVENRIIILSSGMIVKNPDGKITHCKVGRVVDDSYEIVVSEGLHISTYQGDKFSFVKELEAWHGIDIYEKFKELDSYFL